MNNWALITGATAGIGRALAEVFAANHFNLVLVARTESRLKQVAGELQARHGITARSLPADLSQAGAPAAIFEAVGETPISILVNNAGFGWQGAFAQGSLQGSLDMMHVNMDALVQLTRLFLPPMLARREGRILNVASTAAFLPGPMTMIYYATKAFVFSFSVALGEELSGTGVTVTTLCPGFTHTEFQERAGMRKAPPGLRAMSAESVARIGYRGLMKGQTIVVPGLFNKVAIALARRFPVRLTTRIARRINAGRRGAP